MNIRKILLILLLLVCLFNLPVQTLALGWEDSGTCGENLTWTLAGTTLTISGTGSMEDYSTYYLEGTAPWLGYAHDIKKIVIEEGVTSIGYNAFYNCRAEVMIPASVTSINDLASPTYLASFIQGHRRTEMLGIWVDGNNPNYSSDDHGVLYDKNKTSLILAPVTLSGEYIVPAGVISIDDCAFYACEELTNVTIPDTLTSIGDYAFYSCIRLTSVTIPASVTDIGENPFKWCGALEGIWVDENNPNYSSDSRGVLFDKNKTRLIRAPEVFEQDYSIPYGVLSVDAYAFESCSLTKLTIPDSVVSIGDFAFSGSGNLNGVTIPESVISIGSCPFRACMHMYEIWVDEGNPNYSSDGRGALFNKDKTHLIQVPRPIMDEYAIPDGVTSIGDYAFYFCPGLTDATIPASLTFVGECAFSGTDISNVTIPGGMEHIGNYAFESCRMTELTISEGVTSIGDNAFHDCSGLTRVTIPEGVTSIGDGAFAMCYRLTNVTLPDSLISIGDTAFENCRFTNIAIPGNVRSIGSRAFINCTGLTKVTIPDSVVFVGDQAFAGCYNLTDATISHNAASVVEFASYKRAAQNSMTIAREAFGDCLELSSIRFIGDAPIIFEDSFLGVTANAYYPNGNTTWVQDVMQNYGGTLTWIPLMASGFADVPEDTYYATPVLWAVENGITTGMTETTFVPDGTCTRAQIVTFLWRANGSPAPASANNPFTDVPAGQWYTDAVLWAVEQGITTGTSATTFSPDASCTRGQVATFLHRAQGKPASSGTNIFTDLEAGAYYYDAVLWAVENGITNGMGDGTFAPDATCTRGQIVTFLYRAMA